MGWVDYQKAFYMIPHRWIEAVLKAIRAPKEVRKAVGQLIPAWRRGQEKLHETGESSVGSRYLSKTGTISSQRV